MDVKAGVKGHLKVLPRSKGKGSERHLLMTPAVGQKGVPDKDTLLQARVQVESDVGPGRWTQVHAETVTGSDVINEPWKAKPKFWTASCLLSLQVHARWSVMIKWRSHNSI